MKETVTVFLEITVYVLFTEGGGESAYTFSTSVRYEIIGLRLFLFSIKTFKFTFHFDQYWSGNDTRFRFSAFTSTLFTCWFFCFLSLVYHIWFNLIFFSCSSLT